MERRPSAGRGRDEVPGKKRLSLKEALRWAYGRQMVDVMTGRTVEDPGARDPEPIHACCLDLPADGPRRREAPAWRPSGAGLSQAHPDAILIHDAVLSLPEPYPRFLVEFGRTGQHPEPCEAIPRPQPFLANVGGMLEKVEHGYWQGEWMEFRVTADETVVEKRPIYAPAGRGKMKHIGYSEVREALWYCPIEYWPDPSWCALCAALAEHWAKALAMLAAELAKSRLTEHEIA